MKKHIIDIIFLVIAIVLSIQTILSRVDRNNALRDVAVAIVNIQCTGVDIDVDLLDYTSGTLYTELSTYIEYMQTFEEKDLNITSLVSPLTEVWVQLDEDGVVTELVPTGYLDYKVYEQDGEYYLDVSYLTEDVLFHLENGKLPLIIYDSTIYVDIPEYYSYKVKQGNDEYLYHLESHYSLASGKIILDLVSEIGDNITIGVTTKNRKITNIEVVV